MDFKPNQNKVQTIQENNQVSALAIAHFIKDHTFSNWKQMTQVWLNGYSTNKNDYNYTTGFQTQHTYSITPQPRPNGGFWGGGGHGSPKNYTNTIQNLVDNGLITFTHINGFKLFTSTKKLKSLSTYGLRSIIFDPTTQSKWAKYIEITK
jgi:hypothetical protein